MSLKKRGATIAVIAALIMTNSSQLVQVFADTINNGNIESNIINYEDIESAEKKMGKIVNKLEKFINDENIKNLDDETIQRFFNEEISELEKITKTELQSVTNKANEKTATLKVKGYSNEEIAQESIIISKTINNIKIEVLDNGIFTVEHLEDDINNVSRTIRTNSARKDYKAWTGMHIFTVSAIGKFDYNSTGAKFVSGTNTSYIKKGTLSIWKVSNQRLDQRNRSTSSKGKTGYSQISANLHLGYSVAGADLTIQDLYVFHEVEVGKGGKVYRNMYSR